MQILQIIAMAKKILDIINSEQAQQVIAAIKELIADLFGQPVAEYVAAKLEARVGDGVCGCPCPNDDDCPCPIAEIDAALAD